MKLMYITNDPKVAQIAEAAGVDRIFVDMEYIGKADRQGGMDTVQSHHTVEDVRRIKDAVSRAEVLVRVNPIHEAGSYMGIEHVSSKDEIHAVVEAGADIVMLPYFKTAEELELFISFVDGRAETMALLETAEAAEQIKAVSEMDGLDTIYIGLNDLSLAQGKKFMFQLLADGTMDQLCDVLKDSGKPYGFGGIAAPGNGMLPAEYIIRDHYRLGSTCVILSRSFCDTSKVTDLNEIRDIFDTGVQKIRQIETEAARYTEDRYKKNHEEVIKRVQAVLSVITARNH